MAKKVFKIIGIVFGAVLLLAGAIFGIMAAMGKFREDPIYPDNLEFEYSNVRVVYDNNNPNAIYKFQVNGTSNTNKEVNRATCFIQPYITPENNNTNLIIICDELGNAITPTKNGYQTKCNQPTYFKINANYLEQTNSSGIVQFNAVGDKEKYSLTSSTLVPLSISVDRKINSVFVADANGNPKGNIEENANGSNQEILLPLNETIDFDFAVNPSNHALNPIFNMPAKQVYVYLRTTNASRDEYILLTPQNITNYNFLSYNPDNGKITFVAPSTLANSSYNFMLAVYPTYDSLILANNQPPKNYNEIKGIVNTTLSINIINTQVEDVVINTPSVTTNLNLGTTISVNDSSSQNTSLNMQFVGANVLERYNNIKFNAIQNGSWMSNNIYFDNENTSLSLSNASIINANNIVINNRTYNFNFDNIVYESNKETRKLIKNIVDAEGLTYTCANGAAFLCSKEGVYTIKMLQSGEYFDFMLKNSNIFTQANNFEYKVETVTTNAGVNNSWKITPINQVENLELLMFVVNNNGTYKFASTAFNIKEEALQFEYLQDKLELNISYQQQEGTEINYQPVLPEFSFNNIFKQTAGSYSACVLVVEYNNSTNYPFNLLQNNTEVVTFNYNGTNYAIVGNINNGSFNNVVTANGKNTTAVVYVAEFKNAYNQTTSNYIVNNLNNLEVKSVSSLGLDVEVKHNLNSNHFNNYFSEGSSLNINQDGSISLLQNGSASLTFHSNINNLFTAIQNKLTLQVKDQHGNVVNNVFSFEENDVNNVKYPFVLDANNNLIVNLTSKGNPGGVYTINLLYNNEVVSTSKIVTLVSTAVTKVTFNGTEIDSTGAIDNTTLNVNITSFNSVLNDYSYTYTFKNNLENFELFATSNNNSFIKTTNILGKNVEVDLKYYIENENIAYILAGKIIPNSVGATNLEIEIEGIIYRVKIVVTANEGFSLETTGKTTTEKTDSSLSEFVNYNFNNNQISANNITIKEVIVDEFGGGSTFVSKTETGFVIKKGKEASAPTILTITKTDNDYTILRDNNFLNTNLIITLNLTTKTVAESTNLKIIFTNSLSVSKNSFYNNTYYAGTKVVLAEISNTSTFTTEPIFKVEDKRGLDNAVDANITISCNYIDGETSESITITNNVLNINNATKTATITFDKAGVYKFEFAVGTTIIEAEINVKPNAIAVLNKPEIDLNLNTADNLTINKSNLENALFTFYKLSNTVTFGEAGLDYINFNNKIIDDSGIKQNSSANPIATVMSEDDFGTLELKVNSSAENSILKVESGNLNVGFINNLNTNQVSETFNLQFATNDSLTMLLNNVNLQQVKNLNAVITNSVVVNGSTEDEDGFNLETNAYNWKTYKQYDNKFNLKNGTENLTNFKLTNLTTENENITINLLDESGIPLVNGNIGKFWFEIVEEEIYPSYEVKLTFTFKNDLGTTLTYTTNNSLNLKNVIILPYQPEDNNIKAIVGTNFNLIEHVFNLEGETIVKNIKILDVDNALLIEGDKSSYLDAEMQYNNGWNLLNNNPVVQFANFVGNTQTINVSYKITYASGKTYNLNKKITIFNKQVLEINYPYNVASNNATEVSVNFANIVTTEDILALNAVKQGSGDVYNVKFNQFETVYISNSNSVVSINLSYDARLNFKRAVVTDSINNNVVDAGNLVVEPLAWWSGENFNSYRNDCVSTNGSTITFTYPQANQNWTTAYMIFKVTSGTGAVNYFKVVIYYTNSFNSPTHNTSYNNYVELSTKGNQNTFVVEEENSNISIFGSKFNFKEAFNINYEASNINFYLASAKYLDGSNLTIGGDLTQNATLTLQDEMGGIGSSLIGATLKAVDNHAVIKIIVMYKDSNKAVNIGSIILYVQPQVEEIVNNNIGNTLTQISNQVDGEFVESANFKTGYYKATITSQKELAMPFAIQAKNAKSELTNTAEIIDVMDGCNIVDNAIQLAEDNTKQVLHFNGTTLNIDNYLDNDLTFTVKYNIVIDAENGTTLIVYVIYTLQAINTPTSAILFTLGNHFDENNGFNKTINFADVVNNYNLEVSVNNLNNSLDAQQLSVTGEAVEGGYEAEFICAGATYNYNQSGLLYFTLPLNAQQYNLNLTIKLLNYLGANNTVYVNVTAKPPLNYINNAQTSNTAVVTNTQNIQNQYSTPMGSYINVEVEEFSTSKNYTFTSVNGTIAKITTELGSKLQLSFATQNNEVADKYVLTLVTQGEGEETTSTWQTLNEQEKQEIEILNDGMQIGFAHMPTENVILLLNIKVIEVKDGKETAYNDTISTYLKLAQTYTGITPVYEVNGSNHDVVMAESEYAINTLFENINNNALSVPNKEGITANIYNNYRLMIKDLKGQDISNYNLIGMGLNNPKNINYLTVTPASNLVTNKDASTLVFANPASSDNEAVLNLQNNNFNNISISYNFRVLNKTAQLISGNNVFLQNNSAEDADKKYYMSITPTNNEVKPVEATLLDTNNNVFYVNNIYVSTNNESWLQIENATLITDSEGARILEFTYNNITFTLTLQNSILTASLTGADALKQTQFFAVQLTMFGNAVLAEDFKFIYQNYSVTKKDNVPTYYGGDIIKMSDLFNEIKGTDNNVTYQVAKASYTINDDVVQNKVYENDEVKALFTNANEGLIGKEFTTFAINNIVADRIDLNLTFNVLLNGYVLSTFDIESIRIISNFVLKNNLLENANNTTYNYVLTQSGLTNNNNFPYKLQLNSGTNQSSTVSINNNLYYNSINLYFGHPTNNASNYGLSLIDEITVEPLNSGITWQYTGENHYIVFESDYNGTVSVYIHMKLHNGARGTKTYKIDLNIMGFANIQYAGQENDIIGDNGLGLTSGQQVVPVSTAVQATNNTTNILFNTTANKYTNATTDNNIWPSGDISYYYSYITANNFTNVLDMWNDSNATVPVEGTIENREAPNIQINLPYNPSTYPIYVIYKFTFNYLSTTKEMYINYKLAGLSIQITPSMQDGATVNVDKAYEPIMFVEEEGSTPENPKTKLNTDEYGLLNQTETNNFLPLFYFNNNFTATIKPEDSTATEKQETNFIFGMDENKVPTLTMSGSSLNTTIKTYQIDSEGNPVKDADGKIIYADKQYDLIEKTFVYNYATGKYHHTIVNENNEKSDNIITIINEDLTTIKLLNDEKEVVVFENFKQVNENNVHSYGLFKLKNLKNYADYINFINNLGYVTFANLTNGEVVETLDETNNLSTSILTNKYNIKQQVYTNTSTQAEGKLLFGINLGTNPLFYNKATLTMLVSGAGGAKIEGASAIINFKGNNTVSAKQFTNLSTIFANEKVYATDHEIIAITNSTKEVINNSDNPNMSIASSWINNQNNTISIEKIMVGEKVDNFEYNNQTITIYPITFECSISEENTNSLCALQATFYYLHTNETNGKLVVVQRPNSAFEYVLRGNSTYDASVNLSLSNMLKVWTTDSLSNADSGTTSTENIITSIETVELENDNIVIENNNIAIKEGLFLNADNTLNNSMPNPITIKFKVNTNLQLPNSNLELSIYVIINYQRYMATN